MTKADKEKAAKKLRENGYNEEEIKMILDKIPNTKT